MNKEILRMQMLAGIITEGQYKSKLNEEKYTLRIKSDHPVRGIPAFDKTFSIDSPPTTMFSDEWDGEEVLDIVKDSNLLSGDVDIELIDSEGTIIKRGRTFGWEDNVPTIMQSISEATLSPDQEQKIIDDITKTLNEGEGFLEKIKSYARKGMITIGILSSLLGSAPSAMARANILNVAQTEASYIKPAEINKLADTYKINISDDPGTILATLKSTNPKVINSKDFNTGVPFTSWNYGAHSGPGYSTGLSISYQKGSDVIKISISQVPGQSTDGFKTITQSAKELGGKSDISANSGEFSIPVSQARKVVDFVKSNVSQLKSSVKTNSIKGIGDNTGPVKPGPVKTKAGSVSIN